MPTLLGFLPPLGPSFAASAGTPSFSQPQSVGVPHSSILGHFLLSQPQPCDHLSPENFPSSCASKPRPIQHLPPGSQRSFKLNTSKVELGFFMTPSTASYPHSPSNPSQFTFSFPHLSEKPLPVFMKTSEVVLTLTLHPLHSHTTRWWFYFLIPGTFHSPPPVLPPAPPLWYSPWMPACPPNPNLSSCSYSHTHIHPIPLSTYRGHNKMQMSSCPSWTYTVSGFLNLWGWRERASIQNLPLPSFQTPQSPCSPSGPCHEGIFSPLLSVVPFASGPLHRSFLLPRILPPTPLSPAHSSEVLTEITSSGTPSLTPKQRQILSSCRTISW